MRKTLFVLTVLAAFGWQEANSQIGIGIGRPGYGYGYPAPRRYPRARRVQQNLPKFTPQVHFSIGYGYPSLDKDQMARFYNYYKGAVAQTGPVTAGLDVQFSRTSAIGLLVSHGEVSAPYYSYGNNVGSPDIYGRLGNWSVMLNMMNYIPVSERVTPYLRTAIGLNIWDQRYTDAAGNKLNYIEEPGQLAYQVSLGTNLYFTKNTSLFLEAGYGKYIFHGGLAFRL